MRTLMWFTIGFSASCGLFAYGRDSRWLLPAAIVAVLLLVAGSCLTRKKQLIRTAVTVLVGSLLGFGWFGAYYLGYLQQLQNMDGERVMLAATASDYGYDTAYGTSVDGIVSVAGKYAQIRLYLSEEAQIHPGDRIEGTFRLAETTPDEAEDSTWFQGKGIFLLGYQTGEIKVVSSQKIPGWCFTALLRQKIQAVLTQCFPEDTSAFVRALLLGDGTGLSYAVNTDFKISGIRHIIAVSGLHISILYGLVSLVTLRRRYLTAAVGIPVLLLFAAVAGFTPSVTRACIMVWLMLLAQVFEREYDGLTALSFAVLVMLTVNPLAVTSVSLQLSAGCVAGILLFNGPINSWLKKKIPEGTGLLQRLRNLLCSSISVSLSAYALITPLCAFYFGTVSLVGVVTNLLTLWVVNLIFNGMVILCILFPVLPAAAKALGWLLSWPVRYVLAVSGLLADFPLAAVYTKSIYVAFWLGFVYLLLLVFLLMKKKQPGVLLCCGTLGLCLALLASWVEPLMSDTRITMLDVGQGQAILLQTEGKTVLVDCGGDSDSATADIVTETLLSQGITRLDGIIITHYDRDHAGALHNLLTRVDTDCLFLPDTCNEMAQTDTAGDIFYIWDDMELTVGSASLKIFGPVYSGYDNENSLCVLFDTEKCDILITGDRSAFGERMLLRSRALTDVDILVAGHHGAEGSTSPELLKTVTPEVILISVAKNNIYGHPDPALLQRAEELGCAVYRTDLNGTITIGR